MWLALRDFCVLWLYPAPASVLLSAFFRLQCLLQLHSLHFGYCACFSRAVYALNESLTSAVQYALHLQGLPQRFSFYCIACFSCAVSSSAAASASAAQSFPCLLLLLPPLHPSHFLSAQRLGLFGNAVVSDLLPVKQECALPTPLVLMSSVFNL